MFKDINQLFSYFFSVFLTFPISFELNLFCELARESDQGPLQHTIQFFVTIIKRLPASISYCFISQMDAPLQSLYKQPPEFAFFSTRSTLPEVFCKKGVLRSFAKFTGKHLYHSLFFNKVAAGLRPAT